MEQAQSMNTMLPAPQCTKVLTCVWLPLQGPSVSVPLLVQSTSVAAPMLVPGTFLLLGTRAKITMQGLAFPPMASTPILFLGAPAVPAPMQRAGVPLQSAAMLPVLAGALLLIQSTPYLSAWLLLLCPCLCLVTCLGPRLSSPPHRLNMSNLLCKELEARELEVERRTRGESFPPRIQSSPDNSMCLLNSLPTISVVYTSVPVHGVTQIGLTNRFTPPRPCQPTQAMAGHIFLTSGIPI